MLNVVSLLHTNAERSSSTSNAGTRRTFVTAAGSQGEGHSMQRCGKFWTDDPVHLGIVSAESGLCATIH